MRGRNGAVGRYGEQVAVRWLTERGMVLLDRNWRCPHGEIDLVLREDSTLVFCEVKTRSSTRFGHPLEAVRPDKAARLRRLAAAWLQEHDVHVPEVRIDLVGVLVGHPGPAEVAHLRGVG